MKVTDLLFSCYELGMEDEQYAIFCEIIESSMQHIVQLFTRASGKMGTFFSSKELICKSFIICMIHPY